jgi:hypothetical protein
MDSSADHSPDQRTTSGMSPSSAGEEGHFPSSSYGWSCAHLRPSVVFRKVTNGFRCEWGAETYAAFRSVVSTAKANRASVLDTVRFVLSAKRPEERLA